MTEFSHWESFYVIVGSSAGALIGLQFVVLTLIADTPINSGIARAADSFSTPTIVHFSAVLLLAGIISAPWDSVGAVEFIWGILGGAGCVYVVIVGRRFRQLSVYSPQLEDWLFHVVLPLVSYGALAASAFWSRSHLRQALFAVGGAAMVLLFAGIHNAWDTVTYHVFVTRRKVREKQTDEVPTGGNS